jgi:hypothetical protein
MFNPDPTLVTLLQATVAAGASDLHITVGRPPAAMVCSSRSKACRWCSPPTASGW